MITQSTESSIRRQRSLRQLHWNEISEPGTYVELSTGNLYRISQESLVNPAVPVTSDSGAGAPSSPLVKLSSDPFIFTLAARMLCVDHNIQPSF